MIQRRRRMGWDSSFDSLPVTAAESDSVDRYHFQAFEWLQESYVRQVVVELSPGVLTLRKPRGAILRKTLFPRNVEVVIHHSEANSSAVHGPYCLIKMKRTYDLVRLLQCVNSGCL
ncbi:hypothetical protein GCK32_016392 [Trichostrongylus colubriformis]|uniref:Uncharacterized protein n=1 Tax=Trichostrongylus colubriformis TaxID=6319 RepID=A0AAN8FVT4_TRICO